MISTKNWTAVAAMKEQAALEDALRDWRKLLYDRGKISMAQRMELAHDHRRAADGSTVRHG
jgi:hypothetical protein